MYKHLLVPVDGSELSLKAIDEAAMMAGATDTRITVATVPPLYPTIVVGEGFMPETLSPSEWETSIAAHVAGIRRQVEKRLAARGISAEFVSMAAMAPHTGIIEAARQHGCDLIVMSSHGRSGISAMLLGSITTKVLTLSKLPVLVCR